MYWIGFYPIQSGNQHGKLHETASIGFLPSALWLLRKPRVDCWRGDRKPLVRDDEAPGAAPGAPAPAAQRPQSVAAPRRSTGADAPRSGVPATLSVSWSCSVLFGRYSLTEFGSNPEMPSRVGRLPVCEIVLKGLYPTTLNYIS